MKILKLELQTNQISRNTNHNFFYRSFLSLFWQIFCLHISFSPLEKMATKFLSIPDWFSNKNILITGGTGFMGKVLISKLLLSCPDIGDIFLLIRKKKGVDSQARLHLILQVYRKLNNYIISSILFVH